ncbi:hypothetical protein GM415_02565 [Pseudodesulfovibrio cashew]|uniref:Uncharacterized protein n=1 Tax=Pseudodesulfovibrio cashew TaxID=2678688 RepID=A0A6I6JEN1_9BACT|nr:hypothetical protein [Pseudodesulfovibrio cashew]QGY39063.1 hypothetical protein GM415_02565 [Pseudodesulfovibrio cashew]
MSEESNPTVPAKQLVKGSLVGITAYFIALFMGLSATFLFIWDKLHQSMHEAGATGLLKNVVATVASNATMSPSIIPVEGGTSFVAIPDSFAILVVLTCGAFGGLIHGIRSFYFHVKKGDLVQPDLIKLVLRPFSGSVLAIIFYLVLRAGLGQATSSDSEDGASIIFYAAVAAIVGMFTDQTVAKLKKVAEAILTKYERPEEAATDKQ